MDMVKLIEQLNDFNENHIAVLCGSGQCACGYLCDKDDCIVVRAATALSTLQAENEKLRETVDKYATAARAIALHLKPFCDESLTYDEMIADAARKASDELERVKQERDAAVKDLNEFLSLDELCPTQCKWCKWEGTNCDGKTPEWRGPQKED